MNERALRAGSVAAAAVLIGGLLIVLLPRHSVTIIQLALVTVAASTGLYALNANVPHSRWISPFQWMSPFSGTGKRGAVGSDELDSLRAKLAGRRQPIENGPPMPPEILRLLKPLIGSAHDLDPDDETQVASVRDRLSPLTWAVLTADPLPRAQWFQTLPSNEREVVDVVHSVMDDLEGLALESTDPQQPIPIGQPRAT